MHVCVLTLYIILVFLFIMRVLSKSCLSSLSIKGFFRKPTSPPLPLREGPPLSPSPFFSWRRLAALGNMKANFHCAHLHNLSPQGTRDVPTALSIVFTTPSGPLVGDRNLREEEETAPPCRSEPFHSMVGGPSEVYASSGAAVFCAG